MGIVSHGDLHAGRASILMVTKQEAKRVLAAAVVSVGRASDPLAEFKARQASIEEAMTRLGRAFDPRAFLAACGFAGMAVSAPEAPAALPIEAREQLAALMARDFGWEGAELQIEHQEGGFPEGFEITFRLGDEVMSAFALPFRGRWVFAPGPVGIEDLEGVTRVFQRHLMLTSALSHGDKAAVIKKVRGEVIPERALWPDEKDPHGLWEVYPLVFRMVNPLGDGRKLYCGYDPFADEGEGYDYA